MKWRTVSDHDSDSYIAQLTTTARHSNVRGNGVYATNTTFLHDLGAEVNKVDLMLESDDKQAVATVNAQLYRTSMPEKSINKVDSIYEVTEKLAVATDTAQLYQTATPGEFITKVDSTLE